MLFPRWIRTSLSILTMVVAVLTPLLLAQFLLFSYHDATFQQLLPIWADELLYWHQASSFATAGLNTGYYTVAEIPANVAFSHFYTWGLFIPFLYGTFAALFGWSLASIPIINLIFMTISVGLFFYVTRLNIVQSIVFGLMLATFIPFIVYSMASHLPVLEQAIALVMATGFFKLVQKHGKTSRRLGVGFGCFILVACLVRVWWGILFLPFMLLVESNYSIRRIIRAGVAAGVLMLVVAFVTRNIGAPYPYWYSNLYETSGMPTSLLENLQNNLRLFSEGNVLEVWQRRQVLLLIGLLGLALVSLVWRESKRTQWVELAFCIYSLVGILCFVFPLYDVFEWRDYRILAPILLMVLAFLVATRRYWIVLTIVGTMLYMMPEALIVYDIWSGWHVDGDKRNAYYAWEAEMQKVLQYDADVPDAWCNTVLHSEHYLFGPTSTLLAVDSGLGLSSPLFLETFDLPFRSRYLMLDDATFTALSAELNVQPLLVVPDGQLYLNLDSACPAPYNTPGH